MMTDDFFNCAIYDIKLAELGTFIHNFPSKM